MVITLLPACVHYGVSGPLPSTEHNSPVCVQGSEKDKQQCRDEIKAIKRAIAKS